MEEGEPVVPNPASNTDKFKPESDITELNENDLEQVSGGTDNQTSTIANKVYTNKMKSAQKNADAIKGLL